MSIHEINTGITYSAVTNNSGYFKIDCPEGTYLVGFGFPSSIPLTFKESIIVRQYEYVEFDICFALNYVKRVR